jgi:hypothetical protein
VSLAEGLLMCPVCVRRIGLPTLVLERGAGNGPEPAFTALDSEVSQVRGVGTVITAWWECGRCETRFTVRQTCHEVFYEVFCE